jgi:uncharacterized protein
MTVELRPLGVNCNIACQYCYQNPQRDAGNLNRSYDIEAMKQAIEEEGGPFSLFGGEPFLLPENDLHDLWKWGYERFGRNSVQTNGTLITENHIQLFKDYGVHVGISIDGPGELNDVRWVGTLERTREATERTERLIERLCSEGLHPSLIATLHRANATNDKLSLMCDWFRYLDGIGITSVRLHILESENETIRRTYSLTVQENVAAFLRFAELEKELQSVRFDVFHDMENLLQGNDRNVTCIWSACDPYTTRAVRGVEGNGQKSNCGRTSKDGIDFAKSDTPGFERYLSLYHTPQEHGGCKDCRFFLMCKGQCPGTAIDNDWRNRTEHCDVWKSLYRYLENKMLERGIYPVSTQPERLVLERAMVEAWATGINPSIQDELERLTRKGTFVEGAQKGAVPERDLFSNHYDQHNDRHYDQHNDRHNDVHNDRHHDVHNDRHYDVHNDRHNDRHND